MVLSEVGEVFKDLCDVEIEILENIRMSADEARDIHDFVILLHKYFVKMQKAYVQSEDDKNEEFRPRFRFTDVDHDNEYYHDYPEIFDTIQNKIYYIRRTMKKIYPPDANKSTPSTSRKLQLDDRDDQTITIDNFTGYSRKQRLFIKMMEFLECSSNQSPSEAKIKLAHLEKAYEKFVQNQEQIARSIKSDSDFEKQLEKSTDIQRRVISLQKKLTKMITPESTSSTSASRNEEGDTAKILKNQFNLSAIFNGNVLIALFIYWACCYLNYLMN